MKCKKFIWMLIIILSMSLFLLTFCEKKSTSSEEDKSYSVTQLLGKWNSNLVSVDTKITTNSNQKAADLLSEGIGSLAVTGSYSATLKYLYNLTLPMDLQAGAAKADDYMNIHAAIEKSPLQLLMLPTYPIFVFLSIEMPGVGNADALMVLTETDTLILEGDGTGINYDAATLTLTATNAPLASDDLTKNVLVNGSLAPKTINVPANTPTSVLTLQLPTLGMGSLIFNDDSTFIATILFEGEGDSINGKWEIVNGNQLRLISLSEGGVPEDTLTVDFSIKNDVLTMELNENPLDYIGELDEEITEQEAKALIEALFCLTPGSLTDMNVEITVTFNKSTSKIAAVPNKGITLSKSERRRIFFKILRQLKLLQKTAIDIGKF